MMPDRFEDVYGQDEDARRRALEELAGGQSMAGVLSKLRTRRQAMEAPAVDVSQVPVSEGLPLRTHEQMATPKRAEEAPAAKRMPRDTALDEAFAAEREDALGAGLSRVGAMASAALTRRKFDPAAWNAMTGGVASPVKELMAKRAAAGESAKAERAAMLADPNSSESIRMRATIKAALPNVPDEVLAGVTAADAGSIFDKLKEGAKLSSESEARRLSRQEAAERYQDAASARAADAAAAERRFLAQLAESRAARGETQQLQMALAQMGAKERAAAKEEERTKGTIIPGLEAAPGAQPTPEDAKKVKASMASAERMRGLVKSLRDLHTAGGTEFVGENATKMRQLSTAIQLEAKNLAELGALSGPDQALMEQLAGSDPSSLGANLKAFFTGGKWDTTSTALKGLEDWVGGQVEANQRTYGYQPKGGAPKPDTPAVLSPVGAGEVRVRFPDGTTGVIPRDRLDEAKRDLKAVEVT